MKYMMTALVCGLLALALIGCHHSGSSSPASSVPAASSRLADTASSSIRIQLTRVEQQLTAVDGQVLVEYGYDRPIVSISGNATAQNAIQADLDATIQTQLVHYAKEKLFSLAHEAYQQNDLTQLPLSSQLNLSIQRTDEAVISIRTDQITSDGGPHVSDYRSAKNYRTDTGQQLTFAMLGDRFRDAATELVTQQADQHADRLFEDYRANIQRAVLDGTERAELLNGSATEAAPTFYLTNDSIVFFSRECELQTYAEGTLEFPILYDDFEDALDRRYLPSSSNTPLAAGDQETVSADAADSSQTAFQAQDFLVRSGKITGDGWTLSLHKEWAGKVYVEQDSDLTAFYENGCYSEMGGGWLFSLETFSDESYVDRPDYELLSINGGVSYVAIYPTDVQFEGASSQNAQRYSAFSSQVEGVLRTFALSS